MVYKTTNARKVSLGIDGLALTNRDEKMAKKTQKNSNNPRKQTDRNPLVSDPATGEPIKQSTLNKRKYDNKLVTDPTTGKQIKKSTLNNRKYNNKLVTDPTTGDLIKQNTLNQRKYDNQLVTDPATGEPIKQSTLKTREYRIKKNEQQFKQSMLSKPNESKSPIVSQSEHYLFNNGSKQNTDNVMMKNTLSLSNSELQRINENTFTPKSPLGDSNAKRDPSIIEPVLLDPYKTLNPEYFLKNGNCKNIYENSNNNGLDY